MALAHGIAVDQQLTYRRDVDGLRGIAVASVVLFHAGFAGFGGGFVGVDVFFVISGFLITSLILREATTTGFSFVHFYERRVRRIFPALFAMLLVSSLVGFAYLLPQELSAFSLSVETTALFSSNMEFWREGEGYFGLRSEVKPLLHTWSLAVEEQFYLVFPCVLLIVLRWFPRRWVLVLGALLAVSFAMSAWAAWHAAGVAFYWAPLRGWELLIGCLLASGRLPRVRCQVALEALAAIGLAGIVAAVLLYSSATPFPGFAAAVPCLGTGLVIYANGLGVTRVARLLGVGPLHLVGLMSYSLYLWHWPLLVFSRLLVLRSLSSTELWAVIGLALAFAAVSWKVVEQPFRRHRGWWTRKRLFVASGVVGALLLAIGGVGLLSAGLPGRLSGQAERYYRYVAFDPRPMMRGRTCYLEEDQRAADLDVAGCAHPASGRKNVLLWGDSHAAQYQLGLEMAAEAGGSGVKLLQASYSACPPLLDWDSIPRPGCREFNDTVFGLVRDGSVDGVILSAHWVNHRTEMDEVWRRLGATLTALAQRNVRIVLIGPSMEYVHELPVILVRRVQFGPGWVDPPRSIKPESVAMDAEMARRFGEMPGVRYVSVFRTLCPDGCPYLVDDVPMLWDDSHLTDRGSIWAGERLGPAIWAGVGVSDR